MFKNKIVYLDSLMDQELEDSRRIPSSTIRYGYHQDPGIPDNDDSIFE